MARVQLKTAVLPYTILLLFDKAASASNHHVKFYHRPSLTFIRDLTAHADTINEITFVPSHGEYDQSVDLLT